MWDSADEEEVARRAHGEAATRELGRQPCPAGLLHLDAETSAKEQDGSAPWVRQGGRYSEAAC